MPPEDEKPRVMRFVPVCEKGTDMETLITVPTGHIFTVRGENGLLEALSLGDYGKDVNVKCDAMGLTRDLGRVEHAPLLPLEKKWVITISTQYGCSMGCKFCDVPRVGPGVNATFHDMELQIMAALSLHPEVKHTDRLNLHFARMGEPTFNYDVLALARSTRMWLRGRNWGFHPVISTMMPNGNPRLAWFIKQWIRFKNYECDGNAGLQLSINSTDEDERRAMFSGNALTLADIGRLLENEGPVGRKFTLNFALAGYEIDPSVLLRYFNPEHFLVKLTPMHKTATAIQRGIRTAGDYTTYEPYRETEESLKSAGYDVLVFIASREEDEGRITCGNAILSGTKPA